MNKYNSIRETFTSDPLFEDVLANKTTPPNDLSILVTDMATPALYAGTAPGINDWQFFTAADQPRIVQAGLFCNMADGLVYIDNPDTFQSGISFALTLEQYDGGFGLIGTALDTFHFKLGELNQLFEVDFLCTGVRNILPNAVYTRLIVSGWGDMLFSTISVNPDYAAKRIIFRPIVVIEHTFQMGA